MGLPRTFVGFSSTDIHYFHMMLAWKEHEHIAFNFADFQLGQAINSQDEYYIKRLLRARIGRSDTYALLIGTDTWKKTTYVKWEVEVAIELDCRLIGININHWRFRDAFCPNFFADKGALFVPFSSRAVALALEPWHLDPPTPGYPRDFFLYDRTYIELGYQLVGNTAVIPPKPNPYAR
jgi:hypothetical protein